MKQDFTVLDELGFKVENGLCFSMDEAENNAERLYMDEAEKLGANALFFRRFYREDDFENKKPPYHSEPVVYIFHKQNSFFNSEKHIKLHAALWSAGRTEVYVIQTENRIDIINARKPAQKTEENKILIDDSLKLASNALESFNDKRFSAHLFGSGTFWEQSELKKELDVENSPYIFLLDYLMEVRERLNNAFEKKLNPSTLDRLLILSILIKFLEEIRDDNGRHTLRAIYKKHGITSFAEALEKNLTLTIIGDLKNEFNGKIFDQFTDEDKIAIQKTDLNLIAQFLRANIELDTNQYFLWEQYSFQHLPAEVISAIYENFIQADAARTGKREKGVVYTPIHLVNLLVDEVMPLENPALFHQEKFRVLDPACGSGVFLVAAYKRMLQWWAINNSKNGIIQYPDKEVAQKILEDNIFGVDIEETAVLVSVFGLTIALLDKLTPKEIWDNLKFRNLSEENIKYTPFTKWAEINREEASFDLVIGNPPFNPSSKGTITNEDLKKLFATQVPGNKLALKFFEAALFYGKKVSMIIPSSAFLYNKARTNQKYRANVFTENTIEKIYDFTHLRETLFTKKKKKGGKPQKKTGRTPVVALVLETKPSEYQSIEHIIVKRETFSEKKVRFEINYYDRHTVRWDWAISENMQFIWKTNLLGGGRLFHLIYRLNLLENLKAYLKDKKENNDWEYNVGYVTKRNNRKTYSADFITGKPTIKPKSFSEYGEFEITTEVEESFVEIRKKELFEPPHIIFKLVLEKSKIPMAFVEEYLCFNSSYVGISAPKTEKEDLFEIYDRLSLDKNIADLYKTFILSTSPKSLVYHETSIVKEDIDNLPYPEDSKYLIPSSSEKILINDTLVHFRHLGKSIEKTGSKLYKDVEEKPVLKDFGNVFCGTLNEIYATKDQSWQIGKIIQTPLFTKYQFGFGKNKELKYSFAKEPEEQIALLLNNKDSNQGAIHKRIIRYYKHENGYDCVYLIKPNARRYWLKSIALRDADDTFMDLKKDGF